jgi:hypothetical protein
MDNLIKINLLVVILGIVLGCTCSCKGVEGFGNDDFNCKCYLKRYKDLKKAFGNNCTAAEKHYNTHGKKEKRNASCFNCKCYLKRYKDLKKAFGNNCTAAEKHYNTHGKKEKRNASCVYKKKTTSKQKKAAPKPAEKKLKEFEQCNNTADCETGLFCYEYKGKKSYALRGKKLCSRCKKQSGNKQYDYCCLPTFGSGWITKNSAGDEFEDEGPGYYGSVGLIEIDHNFKKDPWCNFSIPTWRNDYKKFCKSNKCDHDGMPS